MVNLGLQKECSERRRVLLKNLPNNAVVILAAAPETLRSGDVHYIYRQNSYLWYLTGYPEPETIMVLQTHPSKPEFILFNRVRDEKAEQWDGPRIGQEGAVKEFGADQAYPYSDFTKYLPELLQDKNAVYMLIEDFNMYGKIVEALKQLSRNTRKGITWPTEILDVKNILDEMRLIKSDYEIKQIKKAIAATTEGHMIAMQSVKPGMMEYELEAILVHAFLRHGCRTHAYPSIVGSGPNTCILHYIENKRQLQDKDLILIDAGGEFEGYAADITRTFPASGQFTPEQKAIYELVWDAQQAAIKIIKPGVRWNVIQEEIVRVITEGLVALKLLRGSVEELIEHKAYESFYMHQSGHWLGMDVHDVGYYRKDKHWRPLEPGMVLTVEPGIYISSKLKHIDSRWHNIGIRIEDDVLVTKDSYQILSQDLPSKIQDIEALINRRNYG